MKIVDQKVTHWKIIVKFGLRYHQNVFRPLSSFRKNIKLIPNRPLDDQISQKICVPVFWKIRYQS